MSDSLSTVADELSSGGGTLAVDSLSVAALRGILCSLGSGQVQDIGPLLELLVVCCSENNIISQVRNSR